MRTFWIFLSANTVLILLAVLFYPYQIQGPLSKVLDGPGHEGHSETSSKMWCLLTYMSHRHHETLKWQNCKYKVKMEISSGIAWQTGTCSHSKSRGLQVSMASTATWKSYFGDLHSHNTDNKEREVSMSEVTNKAVCQNNKRDQTATRSWSWSTFKFYTPRQPWEAL